jgi:seryl-tRNA synthetase
MLDLQFISDNLDQVRTNCANRGVKVDLDRLVALKEQRGRLIAQADQTRHQQKETSAKIPKADAATKPGLIEQGRQLREKVAQLEADLLAVEADLRDLQLQVPNLTHPAAPVGKDESESVTLRTWGEPRKFDFAPLDHVALCEKHDLLDLEAGARVTGHGFYFLKNEAVLLELALIQYAVQVVLKRGFTLFSTPDLARMDVLEGTGYQPRGSETQIYSIANTDLCLVATAEITLGGTLKDQILDEAALPLRYAGISHCFRTEAGAHCKATRGIYRVHQFTKVEMFAFTAPDLKASEAMHEEIVAAEEEIFQGLGLPYRVIDTCTGDLGGPAYRKFDLEAWMPGRNEYGEVTSASNCTDFQARRLGTRCRLAEKKGTHYVHTLNGTAIAVSRALIAVLENYQQSDGSVLIPEILRPWVGKERIGNSQKAQ